MLKKSLLILALAAVSFGAQAQSASKKALIDRILKAQQPGIEAMAQQLAEEPAIELQMRAAEALPQRVAQDKQQAVAKEIEADLKKYAEEVVPVVRAQAVKLAPSTVGTVLDQKFSEDELKQLAGIIESPTYKKFQQVGGEMQKVLTEKLVAETRASVTPKVKALEESISKRLGVTPAK
ncbi:hypothetical protein [Ramlibacter albus]|uniref:DUF2059 domain-containing protein n=1 Tax=Ramlibacter albus TaxID=2079448 RepID=A0A923M7E0_9BURK|nr:hypothetical protein [Ramlibacter albus]MBC5764263.1 hypothetical protein [Ramlibacter albus]